MLSRLVTGFLQGAGEPRLVPLTQLLEKDLAWKFSLVLRIWPLDLAPGVQDQLCLCAPGPCLLWQGFRQAWGWGAPSPPWGWEGLSGPRV